MLFQISPNMWSEKENKKRLLEKIKKRFRRRSSKVKRLKKFAAFVRARDFFRKNMTFHRKDSEMMEAIERSLESRKADSAIAASGKQFFWFVLQIDVTQAQHTAYLARGSSLGYISRINQSINPFFGIWFLT